MLIPLGSEVQDKINGFKGIVTGYVQYISGCNQCLVAPPVGKDKKIPESHWLDEQRLEVLKRAKVVLDNSTGSGFDIEAPKR